MRTATRTRVFALLAWAPSASLLAGGVALIPFGLARLSEADKPARPANSLSLCEEPER